MQAITLEEMVIIYEKAVNAKDYEEMDKWATCIRAENDFRRRVKERNMEKRENLLRFAMKESYNLTK